MSALLRRFAGGAVAAAAPVSLVSVTNLYDDARGTTAPGDVYSALAAHYYNNVNGAVVSSPSITAYATSGRIPCTAETPIVISLDATHYAWKITTLGFHNWDVGGTWQVRHSSAPRFVLSADFRSAIVTPSHTGFVAVTFRYQPGAAFNLLTPIPGGAMAALVGNVMVNQGVYAAGYSPYGAPGTVTTPDAATDLAGRLCVVRAGSTVYVRTSYDDAHDLVHRMVEFEAADYSQNPGPFYRSIVIVDKTIAYQLTPGAFAANFVATYANDRTLYIVSDNDPAYRMNGYYMSGNHGLPIYLCTTSSHGQTFASIGGQRRTIGGNTFIVVDVPDDTHVVLARAMTGTVANWTYAATDPGTGTLAHASGAGDTGSITISATVQTQLWPGVSNSQIAYAGPGRSQISGNGTYLIDGLHRSDSHNVVNPKDVMDEIEAAIGGSRPDFGANTMRSQLTVYRDTIFDPVGSVSVRHRQRVYDAHTRTSMWAAQFQGFLPRSSPGGDTIHLFVPGLLPIPAGDAHAGGNDRDFSAVADITSNALEYYADSAYFANSGVWADNVQRAPTLFMMGQKSSGGAWIKKLVVVNDPSEGRCADPVFNARAMFLSPANKLYPQVDGPRSVASGDDVTTLAAFGLMNLGIDPQALVHFTWAKSAGRHGFVWYTQQAMNNHAIPMAKALAGRRITEVWRFVGCTALPAIVEAGNTITVSTSGPAGFLAVIG